MKKVSYSWNPNKFVNRDEYSSLSLEERAYFRELLDSIWLSDSQYKILLDCENIADTLKVSKDKAQHLIDKWLDGSNPLLTLELDMSTTLLYGVYEDFKEEISHFNKYKKEDFTRGDRSYSSKISSLMTNEEAGLDFEKSLDKYTGNLPTIRYKIHGQMFPVQIDLKNRIGTIVGSENVNRMLDDVFTWLKKYPEKRKSFDSMDVFLITWARNYKREHFDISDDVEIELLKLIEIEKTSRAQL